MSMRTILGVLVSTLLVAGCAGAAGSQTPAESVAAPSTPASVSPSTTAASASAPAPVASPRVSGAFGGTVQYKLDGAPATTEVDGVADGASVSGTAITTFRSGTHTVKLGCAASKAGGSWVLGGTVEKTTVHGESPGYWSAVLVKGGTPPRIGIWLSADPADSSDCAAFVGSIDLAGLDDETFSPIESGSLVPPARPRALSARDAERLPSFLTSSKVERARAIRARSCVASRRWNLSTTGRPHHWQRGRSPRRTRR